MDQQSHIKLVSKGYIIVRSDNNPQPRIKFKDSEHLEWHTLNKYIAREVRDLEYKKMLKLTNVIAEMNDESHLKLIQDGFTIIRIDDFPGIRIKFKDVEHPEWTEMNTYPSKYARDKALGELVAQPFIIND